MVYLSVFIAFFSTLTFAGSGVGKIQRIELGPMYNGKVFIIVEGVMEGQPTCRQQGNYHFVFDAEAPGGAALLSVVLSAQVAQKNIHISGYNTCNIYNGIEDLRWLRVE
ncbi:hypothetical protein [Rheinheimera pacifica]|uniref:hypothetical protein n=1 Tax=Rheinheimera pacifica TaxID=173990 RepID=UPI002168D284|nr:hypothetical protein [Rheinheimera pacifica]